MADARFGNFKLDLAGMRKILKSDAMRAEVKGHAEKLAAKCNDACYAERGSEDHIESEGPAYRGWTSTGSYEVLGHVSTASKEGRDFQNQRHIIDSFNH